MVSGTDRWDLRVSMRILRMSALIVEYEGNQDIMNVELTNPLHNPTAETLKYDIIPENATSLELPNEFGQSTLVINGTWIQ